MAKVLVSAETVTVDRTWCSAWAMAWARECDCATTTMVGLRAELGSAPPSEPIGSPATAPSTVGAVDQRVDRWPQ